MPSIPLRTFGSGGIHPASRKERTEDREIEPIDPPPPEVWLPLQQHVGPPATPLVKKGDLVVRGQKIAEGGEGGAPIHATISGKVKPIDKRPHPTLVSAESIVIARAEAGEPLSFPEDPDWHSIPKEEMLARIREAGLVGLGGAAFPTHRKLTLPPGTTVDTLVLNGAECEPYLTSDYRLMLSQPAAVVEGALAIALILGVRKVFIGVEVDKAAVIPGLRRAAVHAHPAFRGIDLEVVACEVRYPQGAERQLVTALTGRVVPPRALPMAVRVMVQNVATAAAVHEAVRFRKPLLDRIVTVSGDGIGEPRNVLAPIGTLLSHLVDFCGGIRPGATRIIGGGPMMGRALPRLDLPLIKGMNGLLVLRGRGPFESGFQSCIQCGRCLEACPLGLEPDQVSIRIEAGRPLETGPYGPLDCYECGCCTYVCPSHRPLLQFMQVAKSSLRRAAALRIRT
jgi:H+/Na+-translocating ferredoxin:NAD+ oxidoreductase subunit C